jgi:protein-tyrosine kinase
MSRYYEALRRLEREQRQAGTDDVAEAAAQPAEVLGGILTEPVELVEARSAEVNASPESRFVALTDSRSLGAEKFRALVTRLENLRQKRELKCVQITSSVINEGKTLVSGNLAITLAKHSDCKVLLVEGDLWTGHDESMAGYVYRLNGMPLWFLSAGLACDQPSQVLQSARFVESFAKLCGQFDWVVIDSTPMLPSADANLWSRLVDGMLLVVREGVTQVKSLKSGLAGLDNPKVVGVVLNEASEFEGHYYNTPQDGNGSVARHSLFDNVRAWLVFASRRRTERSRIEK